MRNSARILHERRWIWSQKAVLRHLYASWHKEIIHWMVSGETLEVGGGSGHFKQSLPGVWSSDVVFLPWLDAVLDGEHLPFKQGSLANLVLFDVLHHLPEPLTFFLEAARVLGKGGRLLLIEPYISLLSFPVYRFLHKEPLDWHADPFRTKREPHPQGPFDGNQAIPTLIFQRYRVRFQEFIPELKMIEFKKMDFLLYPLSGGFHQPNLVPASLYPVFSILERVLACFDRFLAFRMFVVLERN